MTSAKRKMLKIVLASAVLKIWTLANGLLIAWLMFYEKNNSDAWWARPIEISSGASEIFAIIMFIVFTIDTCEESP